MAGWALRLWLVRLGLSLTKCRGHTISLSYQQSVPYSINAARSSLARAMTLARLVSAAQVGIDPLGGWRSSVETDFRGGGGSYQNVQ